MARLGWTGAGILFTLAIPPALLSVVIAFAVNSVPLYNSGFEKYHTGATTGLEMPQMHYAARELVAYWNSSEELISVTVQKDGQPLNLFRERETQHLKDVKDLMRLDYKVLAISGGGLILLSVIYALRRRWRGLAGAAFRGCGLTLALATALGIASLVDFNALFTRFHLLSFSNDLWLLDPSRDYLIMLFPQGFWQDVFLICAGAVLGLTLLIGAGAGIYLRKTR